MLDLVEEAGFEQIEAVDADMAVAILESRTDIRVVFTDIDMPGSMDGLKLAASVRDRWPPIEIIITTAGLKPDISTLPARSVFLPKPIQPEDVITVLRKMAV